MFKKLKERIESVDETAVPKRPPGLAVRSPTEKSDIANDFSSASHQSDHQSDHNEVEQQLLQQELPSAGLNHSDEEPDLDEGPEEKERVEDHSADSNASELEAVLAQLSNELASVRRQYDTLVADSEMKEEELRAEIINLETQLDQKSESCTKMEGKFAELNWAVENLTSKLQLYSSHDENETVKQLQSEVSELNKNQRERNLEIELLETRIAALTRKRHDEQTSDNKTIRKLQEAVSSLQQELKESENQTVRLVDDSRLQQRQLANANREKDELVKTIEEQKKTIAKRDREISELKLTHACEMDICTEQHQRIKNELEEKLKDTQTKLKDKEDQLKRLVTELPDQPLTKAVLDGYSRARMVTSFSNTIIAPGTVLKRDNQPLVVQDGDEEEPAILPVEDNISVDTEYEFSHNSQTLLLNEVRSLRTENEQLSEELINKDQTIRVQQQKISDMRKALSKGLKPQDPPPQPPSTLNKTVEPAAPVMRLAIASEVNFQYPV